MQACLNTVLMFEELSVLLPIPEILGELKVYIFLQWIHVWKCLMLSHILSPMNAGILLLK